MTSGIEPVTFRLIAQFLNQLCHRVPQTTLHNSLIIRSIWYGDVLPKNYVFAF